MKTKKKTKAERYNDYSFKIGAWGRSRLMEEYADLCWGTDEFYDKHLDGDSVRQILLDNFEKTETKEVK